ncbi:MAG: DUF1573 domain-containing protein [Phycisphaerales bacterium]|nr:DUF1573 domain-containing protein [Phycisphaerales bacterium]
MKFTGWRGSLVAACVLVGVGPAFAQPAGGAPRFEIDSREFDFGTVWQGEKVLRAFTIRNVGTAPLTLDVESSCGCTVPSKPESPLAPGAETKMEIEYQTYNRPGAANHIVTLKSNDPAAAAVRIQVRGQVQQVYAAQPRDLIYGELLTDEQRENFIEFENFYTSPMRPELIPNQDFGPFEVRVDELEAGRKFRLVVRTRPPIPLGSHDLRVRLRTGLDVMPELQFAVFGFVRPPVRLIPEKILVPRSMLRETKRMIAVQHSEDYPLEITKVSATAANFELEQLPERERRPQQKFIEHRIVVTIPPADQLPREGAVEIVIETTARDEQFRMIRVPIELLQPPTVAPTAAQPATGG